MTRWRGQALLYGLVGQKTSSSQEHCGPQGLPLGTQSLSSSSRYRAKSCFLKENKLFDQAGMTLLKYPKEVAFKNVASGLCKKCILICNPL